VIAVPINGKKPPEITGKLAAYFSLGLNMAVGVAVFTLLGYWADQKWGGGQIWTLVGIFLGLFYCGYEVWKILRLPEEPTRKNHLKK